MQGKRYGKRYSGYIWKAVRARMQNVRLTSLLLILQLRQNGLRRVQGVREE
jgi:hypothetical protein